MELLKAIRSGRPSHSIQARRYCARVKSQVALGKPIAESTATLERITKARVLIEQVGTSRPFRAAASAPLGRLRRAQYSGEGSAAAPVFSSGFSVTSASVVSIKPATDAAFCKAQRTTFVGSMMPAFIRSSNSSLAALKP